MQGSYNASYTATLEWPALTRLAMTTSDTGLPENLPGFDDPIGLLRACHEKMLHHCDLLDSLTGRNDFDTDAREAARNIMRYFTQSAPQHHRDEEEDIFPRINRLSLKTAELIHNLKKEHDTLDALWKKLEPGLKKLPDDGFSDEEIDTLRLWAMSKAMTIAGGSSEIQLNVIAKRVLGLPDE